ncbi:MAG: hypothetical protein MSA33_01770, partial [Campylobacter sp.]|uniref:hypothetical protein n=1 Tax=Campylobacter sp. TaxID=205 RepID=UPI002AA91A49
LDKFGGSDSKTFKDFFKQFCEECFKTNVDMAYDTKICPGFQVLRSEDSAYAIIIGSIEYSVDYYTARDIESEEDDFIRSELYFNKSELCLNNKKKNNSAESDVQQNHEQNNKDKRFLELFVFNIRNGFKVMVVAKRIWENIYTKKPTKRNEHIKACIEQAKWYKENCKCLFYNDEKAKGDESEELCVALFIAPIVCKQNERDKRGDEEFYKNGEETIIELNKTILEINKELGNNESNSGLITGILEWKNLNFNPYEGTDDTISHTYIGALVLK